MPQIKAVVFDSDGTLMDSVGIIVGAYTYVAEQYGYPAPTEADILEQLRWSHPLGQILQTFFPATPLEDLLQTNSDYILRNAALASAFVGIRELLTALQERGLKLAIVTGGGHKIHDQMRHHGLDGFFTSIVHSERVSLSKPDPEGFRLALQECDVQPTEAVMVGDSPNDILAGKRGDAAATIGICHGHATRADLQAADADYVVPDVAGLQKLLFKLTDQS